MTKSAAPPLRPVDPAGGRHALTALDWVVVGMVGLMALGLLLAPILVTPVYAGMFEDFGSSEALPALTRLVLAPWWPPLGGLAAAGLLALALTGQRGLGLRRGLLVGAFFLVLGWGGLCGLGLYLPIFAIAGAIQP